MGSLHPLIEWSSRGWSTRGQKKPDLHPELDVYVSTQLVTLHQYLMAYCPESLDNHELQRWRDKDWNRTSMWPSWFWRTLHLRRQTWAIPSDQDSWAGIKTLDIWELVYSEGVCKARWGEAGGSEISESLALCYVPSAQSWNVLVSLVYSGRFFRSISHCKYVGRVTLSPLDFPSWCGVNEKRHPGKNGRLFYWSKSGHQCWDKFLGCQAWRELFPSVLRERKKWLLKTLTEGRAVGAPCGGRWVTVGESGRSARNAISWSYG